MSPFLTQGQVTTDNCSILTEGQAKPTSKGRQQRRPQGTIATFSVAWVPALALRCPGRLRTAQARFQYSKARPQGPPPLVEMCLRTRPACSRALTTGIGTRFASKTKSLFFPDLVPGIVDVRAR